ncbi:MAG: biotin/lipoyl-binding protein [Anaerolineales bacterium]|jgi:biotin carboxyl carrier protein|nr:biotin/lipoyl-binding protein [Anaerolineales bacterium]MBX3005785.1 biotin/lipoyl-binding protein [Anaerolineales bacterium]
MKYITTIDETQYEVEILSPRQVSINGTVYEVDFKSVSGQPIYSLLVDGKSYQAHVYSGEEDDELQVLLRGVLHSAKVEDEREKRLRAAAGGGSADGGEFVLKAPMPGLIVKVAVNEGDEVKKGDVLVILESMKMQNELKSPRDGKVSRVQVKAGDSVEQRTNMVSIE